MTIDFSKPVNFAVQTEFESPVHSFVQNWFDDSDTVMVQTSGSTGAPKLFEIEKKRMRYSAKLTCDFLQLSEGNTALLCLPVEFISGKMMIIRAIERKLKLKIVNPTTTPLATINHTIDFCAMSPLQVENSLDKLFLIKNLIIGGAAVSESLKTKISQHLRNSGTENFSFETYGMSETLSHIALKQIYPAAEDYFQVLEGIQISTDERGCLKIDARQLNPEIIVTNDLVQIKPTDNHEGAASQFKFLGRIDNMINSAGLKINPEILEMLVKKTLPNEVAFLGVPDELLGEKLVLVIEAQQTDELEQQLLQLNYPSKNHAPKETIFLPEFPRLANGKIDRLMLKKLFT